MICCNPEVGILGTPAVVKTYHACASWSHVCGGQRLAMSHGTCNFTTAGVFRLPTHFNPSEHLICKYSTVKLY